MRKTVEPGALYFFECCGFDFIAVVHERALQRNTLAMVTLIGVVAITAAIAVIAMAAVTAIIAA